MNREAPYEFQVLCVYAEDVFKNLDILASNSKRMGFCEHAGYSVIQMYYICNQLPLFRNYAPLHGFQGDTSPYALAYTPKPLSLCHPMTERW